MSTFTWSFPSPAPSAPPTSPRVESTDTDSELLFGMLDQDLDPVTRDYIDTVDGAWAETASSRAAVMMQLEIRYNEWHVDWTAGSRIPAMLEGEDPVTPDMVVDETRRALQVLVEDGLIADVSVAAGAFDDEAGRLEVEVGYTDVVSGHAVAFTFVPG
jgi:hypothetical protein